MCTTTVHINTRWFRTQERGSGSKRQWGSKEKGRLLARAGFPSVISENKQEFARQKYRGWGGTGSAQGPAGAQTTDACGACSEVKQTDVVCELSGEW